VSARNLTAFFPAIYAILGISRIPRGFSPQALDGICPIGNTIPIRPNGHPRSDDHGFKKNTKGKTMNASQTAQIAKLTKSLGIGTRADQGIKHVLGKMPINMSVSRAQSVIDALTEEWNASEAKADADHDLFMRFNNYADC
jgi:hypothetical protein